MKILEWMNKPVITRQKMDEIHTQVVNWAAKKVLNVDIPDFPITIAAILEGDNSSVVIPNEWETHEFAGEKVVFMPVKGADETRYESTRQTGRNFPFFGLKGAFMASTAWMSVVTTDKIDTHPRPVDDPNRQEVLVVCDWFRGAHGAEECRISTTEMTSAGLGEISSALGTQPSLLIEFVIGIGYSFGSRGLIEQEISRSA